MLVLSRKPGESVVIGGNITVTVVEVRNNRVRLAFDAPGDVDILRAELVFDHDRLESVYSEFQGKPAEWQEAFCG